MARGERGRSPATLIPAALLVVLARPAGATGAGPPEGVEVLFYLFLLGAAVVVLAASTVLYLLLVKRISASRTPTRWEKVGLFLASMSACGLLALLALHALNLG